MGFIKFYKIFQLYQYIRINYNIFKKLNLYFNKIYTYILIEFILKNEKANFFKRK